MAPTTFVVPLDGSEYAERAMPIAKILAERVGGRILLASSSERGPLHPTEYLAEVAARFPETDVDAVELPDGPAANAITTLVAESTDRVVCMTSHGRGRMRWSVLGSVAEEIIRQADRPVILVGRHCQDDFLKNATRLLVGVDGSEASAAIAPAALEWAKELGLGVEVAIVTHALDVESAEHSDELEAAIAEPFGGPTAVHATALRVGYVAGALADYAADLPAGLIAMSSHARVGVARVALGSVTMGVLHLAECPLIVVHRAASL